nr:thiamine pyrophosphate-dependent enzyme [Micromonospora arborensis]
MVVDSGNFMGYPSMWLDVPDVAGFCFTQAFQSIGLGLASALGAAVARPDRLTVAAVGDGGFVMSATELVTAVRLALPLLVVIYDDAAYGAEVHHFGPDGHPLDTVTFPETDLAAIARGYGCDGLTVRTVDDLGPVRRWLAGTRTRPLVIDAKVSDCAWVMVAGGSVPWPLTRWRQRCGGCTGRVNDRTRRWPSGHAPNPVLESRWPTAPASNSSDPQSRAYASNCSNVALGSLRLATRIERKGSGSRGTWPMKTSTVSCGSGVQSGSTYGGVASRAARTGPACWLAQRATVRHPALCATRIAGSLSAQMAACSAATRSAATYGGPGGSGAHRYVG